jgi:hypothetical protein
MPKPSLRRCLPKVDFAHGSTRLVQKLLRVKICLGVAPLTPPPLFDARGGGLTSIAYNCLTNPNHKVHTFGPPGCGVI